MRESRVRRGVARPHASERERARGERRDRGDEARAADPGAAGVYGGRGERRGAILAQFCAIILTPYPNPLR